MCIRDSTYVVSPGERKPLAEEASAKPAPFVLAKPDAKYKTVASDVDRSKGVPSVDQYPALKLSLIHI